MIWYDIISSAVKNNTKSMLKSHGEIVIKSIFAVIFLIPLNYKMLLSDY